MRLLRRSSLPVCAALLLAPVVWPQQTQQQDPQQQQQQQQQTGQPQQPTDQSAQPIPAYRPPLAGLAGSDQQQDANSPEAPDTRPLAGAQDIGLGGGGGERNYWQPSVSFYGVANSGLGTGGSWIGWATILGTIDAHRQSARNELTLTYTGGGMITSDSSVGNFVLQQLVLGDTITFRRSKLSFFNYTSYMPLSSFGFGGLGGVGLPGTGTLGLEYELLPQETIFDNFGARIANSNVVQLDTFLTPRSSITMVGGYSLLHFFKGSFLDSNEPTAKIGYNYQMSRLNTFAASYNFAAFQYTGLSESIYTQSANLAFGRRVTGRMALKIAGGPQAVTFNVAPSTITTPTGTQAVATPSGVQLYWDLNASAEYALDRSTFGLSYTHGVNGGSGVLLGAESNIVLATVDHQVSRQLRAGLSGGYARNKEILGTPYIYTYWYGTAHAERQLGRTFTLILSYEYERQHSAASFCIADTCGHYSANIFSAGLTWKDHPIAF